MTHTFVEELAAQAAIYNALQQFAAQDRDRILRLVTERLARERSPTRLPTRLGLVEHIDVGLPAS